MSVLRFTNADDLHLIRSIKEFPVLYNDERLVSTRNSKEIRESWKAIAVAVGRNEDSCKKRWRDIRDHYFKIMRKHLGRGEPVTSKWLLFDALSFLNNARRKRRYPQNEDVVEFDLFDEVDTSMDMYRPETTVKEEADQSEAAEPEYVEVAPPPPHHLDDMFVSRDYLRDVEDDVDVFMRSVAMTVKRMPPVTRAEAKMKILEVVSRLEFTDRSQNIWDPVRAEDKR